jgi:UDP-N-acetylmuramoyl-tripeptide--D-alanyl-D-alanine ligase
MDPSGVVVLNADDPWAPLWRRLAGSRRMLGFGMGAAAEVRTRPESVQIRWQADGFRCLFGLDTPEGSVDVELALGGRHNVMNALAAAAGALALGSPLQDIRSGLAAVRPVKGRLETRLGKGGLRVIDDTYNANPDSVAAAVELLASAPGERWLVLGDLAELGSGSERLHEEIGGRAREAGIERLFTLGGVSAAAARGFGSGACHFGRLEELLADLSQRLPAPVFVLVKGSRTARMERVADALVQES